MAEPIINNAVIKQFQREEQQRAPVKTLGKEEFLRLLTTQMKAQNPLEPTNSQEFASQLTQYSSLEQLINISKTMEEQAKTNLLLTQTMTNSAAPNFIGKSVRAASTQLPFDGTNPTSFTYELPVRAAEMRVEILSPSGIVVREMDIAGSQLNRGEHSLQWDGRNKNGALVGAGQYTIKVSAKDTASGVLPVQTFSTGVVSGVRFRPEGTVLVVNGVEVPVSEVSELR